MKTVKYLILIFLCALFASCPSPIDEITLNQAEDTLAPRIIVSAPGDNSIYNSSVEVTGIVNDDAIRTSDGQGVIESFSYEILYDPDRRGGIVLAPGGTYQQDPAAGTGTILYTPSTGAYSFTVSTVTPSILSGQVTLRITTTDSNGNSTVRDVKLLESGGPVITLTEPGGSVTEFDTGEDIDITGTIFNSNQSTACDQISRIEWNANNAISGTLILDGTEGTFSSNTSQGITFTYNTADGSFDSILRVSDTTTGFYVITVEAEDFNGHVKSVSRTIYREGAGPDFDFTGSTNSLASSVFLSKDNFTPFNIEITFEDYLEVTALSYQARSNAGDAALTEISLPLPTANTYTFLPNGGGSYPAAITAWQDTTEVLQLYVTAVNSSAEESVHLLNIQLDSIAPAISIDDIDAPAANLYNGTYYTDQTGSKTIEFTASDSNSGIDTISFSLNGTPITPADSGSDYFTYNISSASDGDVFTFGISVSDKAGNSRSTSDDLVVYTADPQATVDSVTVDSGSTAYIVPGDQVTGVFSCDHVIDSGSLPTVTINGFSASYLSHTDTTLTYRINSIPDVGTTNSTVDIDLTGLTDAAGRADSFTDISYSPVLTYDPVEPVITSANISVSTDPPAASVLRNGDDITVDWDADADGNTDIASVTVDFSDFGGGSSVSATDPESDGTWTASYTIAGTPVNTTTALVSVTATDGAGNETGPVDDDQTFSIDTEPPVITAGNINVSGATGIGDTFVVGDTVTAVWNATADGNDDIDSVEFDFSDFGGGTLTDSSSTGGWSRTYDITSGSIDTANAVVSVTATDDAENTAGPVGDADSYSVDNEAPTVNSGNISVSGASGTGGTFIVGNTVTAVWDAAADGNYDIDSVEFDFSGFGGGTLTDSSSTGGWSRTYTITAGSIDTTNAVVSVTATDDADYSTGPVDSAESSLDNQAPTVNSASISVTGASGTGGVFIADDEVVATWSGDGNTDIASVNFDFSGFGGGTLADSSSTGGWSRTYNITNGSIDTTSAVVSVTATDDAGNTTGPVSDNDSYSVDNEAPGIDSYTRTSDTEIVINFTEEVCTSTGGTGNLAAGDFSISFTDADGGTDGAATSAAIDGVAHTAGDNSATLTITYSGGTGSPASGDSIEIKPADGSSIYDEPGNPMPSGETSGLITLSGS